MTYQPHSAFAAPAQATATMPRLVLGVVLIEGINSGLRWLFDAFLTWAPGISARAVWVGNTTPGLLLQLFSFGFLALGVLLVAQRLHRRGLSSLTGPPRATLRDLARAFLGALLLFALIEALPPRFDPSGAMLMRDLGQWLLILPVALLALTVQSGAEELFYRGYIQQQLAARYHNTMIWMLVPNVMFALAHWQPGDFNLPAFQYVIWAFFFGLAASDLTARTGTLGAAVGFHLAINAFAFLVFAEHASPDSGLALFLFPQGSLVSEIEQAGGLLSRPFLAELSGVALLWLAVRLALRR
ncbi:CPBP family intramembrane glutamic endopeptidase [Lacimonas salitolerans]|uniref:CPBP family intramembrane glutamic endopeptidase n=1 Tax=Lacimonas salitolerans TaxID=1323750 RepID=A0ABW4EJQ5_9RHOB